MLSQRLIPLHGRRPAQLVSASVCRNSVQRRLASSGQQQPQLTGATDNAFNRERLAVKQHAAESSGE